MPHGRSPATRIPTLCALGSGALLAGLLACAPRTEPGAISADPAAPLAPASLEATTTAPPATATAATATAPAAAAAAASTAAQASAEATAPEADKKPAKSSAARGKCSGWDKLRTAAGEVNCYPYRCQVDRCLISCTKREDCAGSLGPGDMAEHGWPLDCAPAGTCYPLPPRHVHGGGGPG